MTDKYYHPDKLVEWREALNLTQEQVADELNVVRATINRAEKGHGASTDLLYDLADFYRKPISELLKKNKFATAV